MTSITRRRLTLAAGLLLLAGCAPEPRAHTERPPETEAAPPPDTAAARNAEPGDQKKQP